MSIGDLNLTHMPAADYRAPHYCAGVNCPHQTTVQRQAPGENTFRNVSTIPCAHHQSRGEPAALWSRVENGVCPHFLEALAW